MVNGKEAMVEEFVLHRLGTEGTASIISDHTAVLQGVEEQEFLRRLFLRPFSNLILTCEFTSADGKNVLEGLCRKIAKGQELLPVSEAIMKHLIDVSSQHEVRSGDVFIAKFHGVEIAGAHHDAVGIFKFDDKEVFLESRVDEDKIGMSLKRGLGGRKPDQAVLILFTPGTYTVFAIDDRPQSGFWQRDFIGLREKQDHVNSTRNMLEMTKNFITEQLPQDFEIPKADQIDLLNRSVQFFKDNTEFDRGSFAREVFQNDAVADRFTQFGERYKEENSVDLDDHFEISAHAVKKQARVFKSVLKLDKNFHIYIHGDRSRLEQGTDEGGRKFYKIYYDQEL